MKRRSQALQAAPDLVSMIFQETKLQGVFEVHPAPRHDERGFFARTWCEKEFAEHGLNPRLVQCNISFNTHKGTLRGMHYQASPFEEAKLVRCTKGKLYDVVIDLRTQSPSYKKWTGVELSESNRHMLYIPEGCAHGFLTMERDTEISYQMSEFYNAESARGVRWDDAAFGIQWPEPVKVISDRDRTYPDFEPRQ